ncbi:MAG: FAD-binding oxidoreductase [Verrucomicrobia bacterium]|jgi:D-amino-acid dehydrogenase|nr:FAD-binding oxidoreductase [Verrucomicrobiota bacterium]
MKIVVVGAGIVGASAAFHLTELGAEVYFVDSNTPGRATFAGAGIVCPWLSQNRDPRYEELSFAAVRYYPELIARLSTAGETGVDYDLVGGLVVADSVQQLDSVVRRLQEHLEHGVKEIGQVRVLPIGGPKELFPYLDSRLAGVHLSGAARVTGEPLRMALLNAALKAGAVQLSGTAALERSGNAVVGVRVDGEIVSAGAVIVAAGAWSADLCRPLNLRLEVEPQRGQILHLRVSEANTEALPVIVPVLSDYYLLGFHESRVVMGATRETGSGFDFRITAGGVAEVLQEGLRLAPGLNTATLAEIRVGFRPISKDGLPLLGRPWSTPGLVIATGLGRYGLTVGPFAGLLAAKLALGEATEINVAGFEPDRNSAE